MKKHIYSLITGHFKIFKKKILYNVYTLYCVILIVILFYYYNNEFNYNEIISDTKSQILELTHLKDHHTILDRYFGVRKSWKTSNLGSLLFKNEEQTFAKINKTFVVLVWKYWNWLKNRHVNSFGNKRHEDLFNDCSVSNCVFTGNDSEINTADAVMVHILHGIIPRVEKRNTKQIWVFLNDESPQHPFTMATNPPKLEKWANVFNWSMTYRSDSDVPVPYGRTVPLKVPVTENVTHETMAKLIPNIKHKRSDVLVSLLMSNCKVSYRMKFLKELQKHIQVDVYGKCSKDKNLRCPGHFKKDCESINQYYFYLVMENSKCPQYITEKVFQNAYNKGAVPIIVGPPLDDCKTLLPPNSYIHSADYSSLKELAVKIKSTYNNINEYLSFHMWRNHFGVSNEHGYLGSNSYHLCRLCEALNYNSKEEKMYSLKDLKQFLDKVVSCK